MKKTNLMTLAAIAAGSAALWAVSAGPIVGLTSQRTNVERDPLERIIPAGTSFSELPEEGYYTVPFSYGPTTQEEFNESVRPEAACGRTYSYNATEKAFQANYTPNGVYCDFWAYLPGVMMEPGIYKFGC